MTRKTWTLPVEASEGRPNSRRQTDLFRSHGSNEKPSNPKPAETGFSKDYSDASGRILSDRIQRGEVAMARAKAMGRVVTHWGEHLERLKGLLKQADSTPDLVEVLDNIFGVPPRWLYVTITRPRKYPAGHIALGRAETVIDVEKFAGVTIKDVIDAVHKKNHGHRHYWGIPLIEEKIEKLRLCGVEVEIQSTASAQEAIGESELRKQ